MFLRISTYRLRQSRTKVITQKAFCLLLLLSLASFTFGKNLSNPDRLFSDTEPIQLILQMDMQKVLNDKSEDPQYSNAFLIQNLEDNKIQTFNIKIKARGNTRRIHNICEFPPLKLNLEKKSTVNTVFEGQDKLKLVTHCQESEEYQNYAMLEYLAYKTYNTLTDYSYRVRLVTVIYQDIKQNYDDIEKSGFLIEDDDLLASRTGGRITDKKIWSPDSCEQRAVDVFSLFQFMIGNTDWWIHTRHNVDILKLENDQLIPLPFDFDYAGIINTPYAIPSPQLPILKVRDRFFKGSCQTVSYFDETIALFNSKRDNIIAILENADFLEKRYRRTSIRYIEDFYNIINDSQEFSKYLNQTCEFVHDQPQRAYHKSEPKN